LGTVLATLVLLHGGTLAWAAGFGTLALLGWALICNTVPAPGGSTAFRYSWWSLSLMALAAAPLLPFPVSWLPPAAEPALALAWLPRCGFPLAAWHGLSFDPFATRVAVLWLAACLTAYHLACRATQIDLHAALTWLHGLVVLAAAESLYGLYEWKQPEPRILGVPKLAYRGDLTGTFINHSHLAGFLELAIPFLLVFALYSRSTVPLRLAALVWLGFLWAALAASHSRAGMVSAVVVSGTLLFVGRRQTRHRVQSAALLVFLFGVALMVSHGSEDVQHWLDLVSLHSGEPHQRLANWWAAAHLVATHPLLGVGMGGFGAAFRPLQVAAWGVFTHAHNDVLELAVEAGLPFALLLIAGWSWRLWRLLHHAAPAPPHRARPTLQWACGGALLGLLLHSLTDFNLHIPANALGLSVIAGIGTGAQEARTMRQPTLPRRWLTALLLSGLVLQGAMNLRGSATNRQTMQARLQDHPFDADIWSDTAGELFSVAPTRAACAATRAALLGYRDTNLNFRVAAVFALTGHPAPERAALRRVAQYDPGRAEEAYHLAVLQGVSNEDLVRDVVPTTCSGAMTLAAFLRDSSAAASAQRVAAQLGLHRCRAQAPIALATRRVR